MKITFVTSAIAPMKEWLIQRKKNGYGDEASLRKTFPLRPMSQSLPATETRIFLSAR